VCDHFYVDNWLVSYPTEKQTSEAIIKVNAALLQGGFKLTQWASSSQHIRNLFPDHFPQKNFDLDLDSLPVERTLGMTWDFNRDVFILKVKIPTVIGQTKREILRIVSSIFDPTGHLSAVTFPGRSILQETWKQATGWDDKIDDRIFERFNVWVNSLIALESLTMPRCFFLNNSPGSIQLHIFADAGYGAVAYLRSKDGVETSFVMAKSRVAPLRFLTIPRLELCAAVMAVKISPINH